MKVLKSEGDHVYAGEPVLIVEAMKMETEIKSKGQGVVKELKYQVGDQIMAQEVLFLVEEEDVHHD